MQCRRARCPGDFIMVAGVAATTPVFLYGIPYFHNTSTTGTYLGINRTQNYVVANGVAAGGAPSDRCRCCALR